MKPITISTFFALILLGAIFSCSPNKSGNEVPSEQLMEAYEYHQKSLDVREELMEIEAKLKANNIEYADLKEELKTWDKDIIEVPGMEHSHDDHQRKYHVHNPPKKLSDEEHLQYQKMMYEEIIEIQQRMARKMAIEVMA